MKMVVYIILLLIEIVVNFLVLSLTLTNLGWFPCVVTIIIWAVLFAKQVLMLIKSNDIEEKRRINRRIAFVMLVPILGFIIMLIYWFFDLSNTI